MSTLLANTPRETEKATPNATRLALRIGGCALGLWCEKGMAVALDPEHHPFAIADHGEEVCDIELDISWAETLQMPGSSPAFTSGGLWAAFTDSTGTKFYFCSPALGAAPYKAAWLDTAFQRGHVVLNRSCFPANDTVFPLEYPIDELAMMHRLALGEGVEVHALGLVDQDGRGYLFLGHSGAGKSTTARLWMAEPGVKLLSDDRIILRKQEEKFWMYGTPWHGDAGVASAARAPLSSVFLLEQAPKNQILPMVASKAAAELFARSFVPHYLQEGIQFSLSFFDELSRSIPCAIFRFALTDSVVEAIRHVRE
jgi:hypothetical protein